MNPANSKIPPLPPLGSHAKPVKTTSPYVALFRGWIEDSGLRNGEIEGATVMPRGALGKVLNGARDLTLSEADAICRVLGRSLADIDRANLWED